MAIANNKQIYKILIIILAIATVLGVTQYQWILSGYFFNQGVMEALTADSTRLINTRFFIVDLTPDYKKADEEYRKAINDYDESIKWNPNFARAYYKEGQAYYKLEQTHENESQKALDDYKQAQKLDHEYTKSADFHNELGEIHSKLKDFQTAIYEYTQAIKQNEKEADFYNNLGFAYLRINKNDDALKNYRKVLPRKAWELKKQPVDNNCMKKFVNNARNADFCSLRRYAYQLTLLGDYKAAIAYYTLFFHEFSSNSGNDRHLQKVSPKFVTDYYNLDYARYRLGDKEGAIEHLNIVLKLYSDNLGKWNKGDKKSEDIYQQAQLQLETFQQEFIRDRLQRPIPPF